MNPIFIILIATCPIFIITGWVMLKFPPKSSNMNYGYRTKQSRSSVDKWNFSQPYSAIQFIKSGLIGCCLSMITLFFKVDEASGAAIGIGLVLMLTVYPIYKTEKVLKQKFGE